jgi:hypothetical protein
MALHLLGRTPGTPPLGGPPCTEQNAVEFPGTGAVPPAEQVALLVPCVAPALHAWCVPANVEQLAFPAPAVTEQLLLLPLAVDPLALHETFPLGPSPFTPPAVLHPTEPVFPPAEQ